MHLPRPAIASLLTLGCATMTLAGCAIPLRAVGETPPSSASTGGPVVPSTVATSGGTQDDDAPAEQTPAGGDAERTLGSTAQSETPAAPAGSDLTPARGTAVDGAALYAAVTAATRREKQFSLHNTEYTGLQQTQDVDASVDASQPGHPAMTFLWGHRAGDPVARFVTTGDGTLYWQPTPGQPQYRSVRLREAPTMSRIVETFADPLQLATLSELRRSKVVSTGDLPGPGGTTQHTYLVGATSGDSPNTILWVDDQMRVTRVEDRRGSDTVKTLVMSRYGTAPRDMVAPDPLIVTPDAEPAPS